MRRLTLIGMPGSGKSVVGKIIATRLGWTFLDTDRCIEKRHGIPLQELIDQVGDAMFRRLEEETILDIAIPDKTVVATGGSVVYSDEAMEYLASVSAVVFLDAPIDAIRAHILSEAPRGIVGMKIGGLEELYQDRLPRYRQYADLVVLFDSETPDQAASRVLSELPGYRRTA